VANREVVEDEDLGRGTLDADLGEEGADATPGHGFDSTPQQRSDLILEGDPVQADVFEPAGGDQQ
jgi:hypothetical protein